MWVLYIAGPFTADTPWLIENHVRRAEELSLKVCALGGVVALCPHTMYRFFHRMETSQYWYEATLELLRRCDGIVLIHGWELSKGSVEEHKEATKLGLRVFHENELELIREWVSKEKV
jgi:hypothetical protein